MRLHPLLLSLLALGLVRFAFAATPEEPLPAAGLPPVKVRLASLGTPARLTLRAGGKLRVTDPAGKEVQPEGEVLTIAVSGKQLKLGDDRAPALRLEGEALTVEAGKVRRSYPGALLLSVSGKGIRVVNECSLEEYTAGVLACECPALFHPEAIKATAVAVRSYSYRKAYLRGEELCDGTHCQVYRGTGAVRSTIREAVDATAGVCALYDGEVIDAVYSADCGGYTEANEAAWNSAQPIPYLRPVQDAPEPDAEAYCALNRTHRWKLSLPKAKLQALFGKAAAALRLEALDLTESGRVRRLQLGPAAREPGCGDAGEGAAQPAPRIFTGEQLRRLLGTTVVRSLKFDVREAENGVELEGRGWGHGVGMCQFGANGMARAGALFDEILRHYYTGIDLAPAPDPGEARALIAQRNK